MPRPLGERRLARSERALERGRSDLVLALFAGFAIGFACAIVW